MEEFKFSLDDILKATQGRLLSGGRSIWFRDISTDSRTIKADELFVALRGKLFDGHHFVSEALERGAGGSLVEKKIEYSGQSLSKARF